MALKPAGSSHRHNMSGNCWAFGLAMLRLGSLTRPTSPDFSTTVGLTSQTPHGLRVVGYEPADCASRLRSLVTSGATAIGRGHRTRPRRACTVHQGSSVLHETIRPPGYIGHRTVREGPYQIKDRAAAPFRFGFLRPFALAIETQRWRHT